jgi:predicted amidohydrolase YtcJ
MTLFKALGVVLALYTAYAAFRGEVYARARWSGADLVILDKNPLKVDPMSIKDIKVLETIKEGKTIYKAD